MRKFILLLVIAFSVNYAYATNNNFNENTSRVDTIPQINPDLAFNLCYNSLIYWYKACGISDSVNIQLKAKIKVYEDITGYQGSNTDDLKEVVRINAEIEKEKNDKIDSLELSLKKYNRRKGIWKYTTFTLVIPASYGVYQIIKNNK